MKLTRDQVEEARNYLMDLECPINEAVSNALCDLALTALSAEPVAWVHQGWFDLLAAAPGSFQEVIASSIKHGERNIPLFTAPPSLLAENARLREALEDIARGPLQGPVPFEQYARSVARAALRGPK